MRPRRKTTKQKTDSRAALVLVSAILLFIAASIGLYIAWQNIFVPDEVEVI